MEFQDKIFLLGSFCMGFSMQRIFGFLTGIPLSIGIVCFTMAIKWSIDDVFNINCDKNDKQTTHKQ